jgi:hypothetical protein
LLEENICEIGASSYNQIINRADSSELLRKEKRVKHLLNLAWDPELFDKKPVELEKSVWSSSENS